MMKKFTMDKITELNDLIYAKRVSDNTVISPRNQNRYTQFRWKMRRGGQIKKLRKHVKTLKKEKSNEMTEKRQQKTWLSILLEQINQKNIGERMKSQKISGHNQIIQAKQKKILVNSWWRKQKEKRATGRKEIKTIQEQDMGTIRKLENNRACLRVWILVLQIHVHPRQIVSETE